MVPAAMVLMALSTSAAPASELAVGTLFPSLELPSLTDGSPSSIGDYRGEKLMLHVWASW